MVQGQKSTGNQPVWLFLGESYALSPVASPFLKNEDGSFCKTLS